MRRPLKPIMEQDGERSGDSSEGDGAAAPGILASVCSQQPTVGSFIGDFSQNSYVFDGIELTRPKRAGGDAAEAGDSDEGSSMSDDMEIVELDINPAAAQQAAADDKPDVYMGSAVDMFMRLNSKMDMLMQEKGHGRRIMEECYRRMLHNDIKGAMASLRPHVSATEADAGLRVFVESELPAYLRSLRAGLCCTREALGRTRSIFERVLDRLDRKTEECERLKDIINRQSVEHSAQVNALVTENNALKDGLVAQLQRHGPPGALDSMLAVDLLGSVEKVLGAQADEVIKYRKSVLEKDLLLDDCRKKASSWDVESLSKQLEECKRTERRLQSENLGFSEMIQRLSIKNTKYKQDLVLFNSELKKSFDAVRVKNETIERQKKLISLFQDKLGGSVEYPIEELKARRREIEGRITKEDDYLKRQILEREKFDCDKRLSDFLRLRSRRAS